MRVFSKIAALVTFDDLVFFAAFFERVLLEGQLHEAECALRHDVVLERLQVERGADDNSWLQLGADEGPSLAELDYLFHELQAVRL